MDIDSLDINTLTRLNNYVKSRNTVQKGTPAKNRKGEEDSSSESDNNNNSSESSSDDSDSD